jgi:Tfp pilus assembly PilM family ATPase
METLGKSDPATLTAEDRRQGRIAPGLTPSLNEQGPANLAPPEFDLANTLDDLTDEVAMCLRYYEAMFPGKRVDRAIFFGGEARHRGLCQHIARKIRLPAQVADPLARMARAGNEPVLGVDFTTPQPGWTIPFGLCMSPTDL